MKFGLAILYAILLTLVIELTAWAFDETYEKIAVPFLVGVVAAILAGLNTKGDK